MMYTARKKEGVHDMKKKQLLELEIPKPTEEMLAIAEKDIPKKSQRYWGNRDVYQYGTYFRLQIEDNILKASIFFADQIRAGRKLPAYLLFIDKEADEFITFDMESHRWRESMLCNLEWPRYSYKSGKYISGKDLEIMKGYLEGGTGEYTDLQRYQYAVRNRQLIRRDKKETDAWDKMMDQVPELPKDWEYWVAKTGISQHFMFYEYKRGGAKKGYCSHCRKMVPIKNPRYDKAGYCSKCRHPVVYKSIGKFGRIVTERENVYLIQRCELGIIVRQFEARSFYRKSGYKTPRISCDEVRRIFFNSEWRGKAFYYGCYKQREYRWIRGGVYAGTNYNWYKGEVYRRTLSDLEKKELRHSGLVKMIRWKKVIDPEAFLASLSKKPILEQIVKAELFVLVDELLEGKGILEDYSSGKLSKVLKIDRNRLQRLRRVEGGIQYLKWLQYEKKYGKNVADEEINWFVKNHYMLEHFEFILDRMSPLQIKNYLLKQQKLSGESLDSILRTWKDYLSMAKRANVDVNDAIIYRASRLNQRHQEMVQIIEEMNVSMKAKEILAAYEGIDKVLSEEKEKYDYQEGEYAIIAPEKVEDILHEGNALHHCVDKGEHYFERIAKRESFILFLRKAENIETPYYTLEVEPGGTIRQKRTKYNRQLDDIDQAETFLRKWQKVIRKRMTEDDWNLADRSKKIRVKELEEMRENKVIVHGGLFGGKLLADLLEEDLMEQNEVMDNAA